MNAENLLELIDECISTLKELREKIRMEIYYNA